MNWRVVELPEGSLVLRYYAADSCIELFSEFYAILNNGVIINLNTLKPISGDTFHTFERMKTFELLLRHSKELFYYCETCNTRYKVSELQCFNCELNSPIKEDKFLEFYEFKNSKLLVLRIHKFKEYSFGGQTAKITQSERLRKLVGTDVAYANCLDKIHRLRQISKIEEENKI